MSGCFRNRRPDVPEYALIGTSDTGDFNNDLTELFIAVGDFAQKNNKCICLFIDEVQQISKEELSSLIHATHRINQLELPLIIICAGLPTILRISGEVKSYSERLFDFNEITSLEEKDAKSALVEPARTQSISYTQQAVDFILEKTGGYPYFIQMYGKCVWKYIEKDTVTLDGAKNAYPEYIKKLDESFFYARYSRTTSKEKEFLFAMAKCTRFPCEISQVASFMGTTNISLLRNNLINKGLIYSLSYGIIDFTVPQFVSYLQRVK